jgi:hypothetical protein
MGHPQGSTCPICDRSAGGYSSDCNLP